MSGQITIVKSGKPMRFQTQTSGAGLFGNIFFQAVSDLIVGFTSRLLALDFTPLFGRNSAR